MAKPRDNGGWLKFRFSSSGKSRGSAAAAAEVEFAGKREVTRDRRPLCVITNRPARTVLFNRTKVQEVHTLAPYSTRLSFFLADLRVGYAPKKKEATRSKRGRAKRQDPARMSKYLREQMISPG